jgi:hypothetical protein
MALNKRSGGGFSQQNPVDGSQFLLYGTPMTSVDLIKAGRLFQEWLEATGTSASAFSRQVPCSTNYPGMWARGAARPSYRMACRIEELTYGLVPHTNWFPAPELPVDRPTIEIGDNLDLSKFVEVIYVSVSA